VSAAIPVQLHLFESVEKKGHSWDKVDRAMDSITRKFGQDAIRRASLRKNDKRRF
jgi:hypothetical protein